jgi:hypothetical protein
MNTPLSESCIVRTVADIAARRIAHKAIAFLQQVEAGRPIEDFLLKNAWDEICVQIQSEYFVHWDVYDETVRDLVRRCLPDLPQHEREAIWLQTQQGDAWLDDEEATRDTNPVFDDDIVTHIASEYIYEEADRWSNSRIRDYIDNGY